MESSDSNESERDEEQMSQNTNSNSSNISRSSTTFLPSLKSRKTANLRRLYSVIRWRANWIAHVINNYEHWVAFGSTILWHVIYNYLFLCCLLNAQDNWEILVSYIGGLFFSKLLMLAFCQTVINDYLAILAIA